MIDLKDYPLRRWQCSDGCRWLQRRVYMRPTTVRAKPKPDDPKEIIRYRCGFWDDFPETLMSRQHRQILLEPEKRIIGPHTDEPTKECPHFTKG